MTFEDACVAAEQLLDQRGTLLNVHLLRLFSGDKVLLRQVREFLIHKGIAEDRAGVGLARNEVATIPLSPGVRTVRGRGMEGLDPWQPSLVLALGPCAVTLGVCA